MFNNDDINDGVLLPLPLKLPPKLLKLPPKLPLELEEEVEEELALVLPMREANDLCLIELAGKVVGRELFELFPEALAAVVREFINDAVEPVEAEVIRGTEEDEDAEETGVEEEA